MDNLFVKSLIDWLHIMATVAWIGGMMTNLFILRPAMIRSLSHGDTGKLMGAVMKRFRILVYSSIVILGVTGIPLKIINENYTGIIGFGNNWEIISFVKHLCYGIMVVLAVYSFEVLLPALSRASAGGSSAALRTLQKRQLAAGAFAFLLAITTLILSSIMRYIS